MGKIVGNHLITYNEDQQINLEEYARRLHQANQFSLPLEEELSILKQATQFELGQGMFPAIVAQK